MGNNQSLAETSVINPPYGTVIPGDGFLAVQIYGANAPSPPADTVNLEDVPVTVTPVTTLSGALTAATKYSSLTVSGLTLPVTSGDTITIGSGSTAQVVTAGATTAVGTGTQTITVSPQFTASSSWSAGTSVTDSVWGQSVYNPDHNGCVYLQEPLGKYTVSLASPSGGPSFIDYQEYLTPGVTGQNPVITSVSTSGLEAVLVTFHYDESGTVTLSPSAAAPLASGMPISVGNQSLLPSGTTVVVPHGSTTTSAPLFPYSTGYSVWYGDCTTVSTVTPEQPASPTTFSLSPQGTAAVSVTGLDTLSIKVTQTGGGSKAPTATATVADPKASTDGCSSSNGEVYTLTGISGSGTSYAIATAILSQTYTVVVTDPNAAKTVSTTMVVSSTGVMVGATNYPTGAQVPVTVP